MSQKRSTESRESVLRKQLGRFAQFSESALPKVVGLILALLVAVAAVAVTAQLANLEPKKAYAALLAGCLAWAMGLYKYPKEVLLFAWFFTLTYNRQFFVLQGLTGDSGMQGPYVIIADAFLLALFALWLYEAAILKRPSKPLGGPLWVWYLPFAAACLLSVLVADRKDWTLFELIRVVKVGLILLYARYNLKSRDWWVCVIAIGCALSVQSFLGILEVTFNRTGVLWLLGMGSDETAGAPAAFQEENFFGFRRATATMNHPPNLACYLLLTIPVCAALGLTHPERRWRLLSAGATVLGLAGLACTLSRWPWALIVVQLVILVLGLSWLRTLSLKHSLAVLALAGALAGMVGLGMADFLYRRFSSDLNASVELRQRGNQAALDMLGDGNYFLGVGLNNYRVHMLKYEPEAAWIEQYEYVALDLHLRFIAGPLNGFLLVLSESGILGLTTFVVYLLGVTLAGIEAVAHTRGHIRAAAFGLGIGFVGVLAQQAIDYSYWVDPVLYTATMIAGMLSVAGSLSDDARAVSDSEP